MILIPTNKTKDRTPIYINLKETAKLIRKALKSSFPDTKFSVRGEHYSMGASIDIIWSDGPTAVMVEEVSNNFEGATFDGMIDLQSNVYHVDEHGNKIHYGSDYVHTRRTITCQDELFKTVKTMMHERCNIIDGRWGNQWVDNIANNTVRHIDLSGNKEASAEKAFNKIVLNKRIGE